MCLSFLAQVIIYRRMSWFSKISDVFTKRKLDKEALTELEELLIMSDLGVEAAAGITESISDSKFDKEVTDKELKEFLADEISEILKPHEKEIALSPAPQVILVVGVNGNGKTTSVGKLAHNFKKQGKKVLLVAADTFRAAAVEQLNTWAARAGVEIFMGVPNQDPASVAYQSVEKALKENFDVVLIDTAGRLQNKQNLMAELGKIKGVIGKLVTDAPQETIMVLDATTGQNAVRQLEEFGKAADVSSLIVTKLDGTAKGGVLVALAQKFGIGISYIGVGEGINDLKKFNAKEFATMLVK